MQFWSNHLQLELITTSLFWFWIYSIFILEFQVKITTRNGADGDPQKGKAFIHYNQKLCRKEIERLFSHFNIEDPGEMSADISYGTNGHKSVCRYLLFSNLIVFCISFSGLNLSEIVQTCTNLSEIAVSCLNMFKLVQSYSKLSENLKICLKLF